MLTICTSYHVHHDIVDFTYALDSDVVYSLYLITLKFTASLHCCMLLVLQRVAQNAKSCSKVAEHNLLMSAVRPTRAFKLVIVSVVAVWRNYHS